MPHKAELSGFTKVYLRPSAFALVTIGTILSNVQRRSIVYNRSMKDCTHQNGFANCENDRSQKGS